MLPKGTSGLAGLTVARSGLRLLCGPCHFSGILPLPSELQAQGCPSAHLTASFSTSPHRDGMV